MKIPIVDEQDEILYYKDFNERDRQKEIIRIACLWLVNEKREVLIAKRSKNKRYQPNKWGPSVAGTIEEGETYKQNVIKEAREEIGVSLDQISLGPRKRVSIGHEYFCQYFFAAISSSIKFALQESEVDEVKWISFKDLKEWTQKNLQDFIPSFGNSLEVIQTYENQS